MTSAYDHHILLQVKILPEPITFQWDEGNKDKNVLKHNISNKECEEVFSNTPLLISEDKKHSLYEKRHQCLGKTHTGKKLFMSFTIRGNKIRIISARMQSRKERGIYEKESQANTVI